MAAILQDGKLTLSGDVGDFFFGDGFTHSDVVLALAQVEDEAELTVYLNSGGGYASEGAAIHALLSRRAGQTDIVIDGVAASAASLIAMAGDTVTMSAGAIMMIHDPAQITIGDAAAHAKTIEELEALATSYARVYAAKSGKSVDECRSIMKAETWMSPEEAVAAGFADAPGEAASKPVAAFDYRAYAHAPQRLKALASRKNWRLPDAKTAATAASTRPTEEKSMTDTTTGGAPTVDIDQAKADAGKAATARIKAIMTAEAAKGREKLADHFAYETEMTAEAAIAALEAAPKATAEAPAGNPDQERRLNGEGLSATGGTKPGGQMRVDIVANMKRRHGVSA